MFYYDIDLSLYFFNFSKRKQNQYQRETLFEMASSNFRRSKQDKLLEGTLNILKDNKKKLDVVNKLMYFIDCLNNAPMNENDVVSIMNVCKDYLKHLHSTTLLFNLPKLNSEVKEIIDVLNRIERQSDNDSDNQVINNLSRTFDDVSTENTNPGLSDVISYLV